MKNIKYTIVILGLCMVALLSCEDPLEKENLSAVSETSVWDDAAVAQAFLDNIYENAMGRWPINASAFSDNSLSEGSTAEGGSATMYGELVSHIEQNIAPENRSLFKRSYEDIRSVNILLENVGTGEIPVADQDLMKAQALFFRAKIYFDLVSAYGGVPLILEAQDREDDLFVSRNSTSECITQIIADLDAAITMLPDAYLRPDTDYGRVTKGGAMALKGRILLHYASEQFDPGQAAGRWQTAYDANKEALTYLEGQGKGLHPSFKDLWFDESDANPEAIMIRRYAADNIHKRDAGVRPFVVGTSGESYDKPTLGLVEAFPMKDGKAITDGTSAYTYNTTTFWLNRDPRFDATIAWNGAIWPLNDPSPNRTSELHWSFQESAVESQANDRISDSGFYSRKAIDGTIQGGGPTLQSTTDWIEIRFAEVLLNTAEAANEIGNTAEAYTILGRIRERAGIDAGSGQYGLAAGMDQGQMREAVLLERRLEMAFEGIRPNDLRRRRLFASLLNGSQRRGYIIRKTAAFDALNPSDALLDDRMALEVAVLASTIDLNDPAVYNTYFETSIRSVERFGNETDDGTAINFLDKYYFYDIPQSDLDKNPQLEQNQDWGGAFNPLQ